jgi:hypothetical protein
VLGLGSNITGISKVGTTIVTDNLVLRHDYKMRAVEPLSSGAASFNGTSDYIDCGDIGAAKSLAFWFKTSTNITSSSNYQRVFGFSSSYYGISLGAATGSLSGEVLTVLSDNSSRTATTTTFDLNTWYHACISWNASSNYFDVYINGVLSTDLSTGTHTLADWDSFIIGTDNTTGTHFGGYICNVGVWNAALSQAQIKSIMNKNYDSLSASEKTDLVSWWNLDSTIPGVSAVYDNHGGGLGEELVSNGDFSLGDNGDWTTGTGITISGGSANFTGNSNADIRQNAGLVTGTTYKATFTISNYVSGDIDINVGGATRQGSYAANGDYTIYVISDSGNFLYFQEDNSGGGVGFTGSISNVSVKEINGNTGTLS